MDEQKVTAVCDWLTPRTVKELHRFLGFFYRRFIHNFSQVAAPLTNLTCGSCSPLRWTPEATIAFAELKLPFCSAPVLRRPDPEIPFHVEVDASDA